MPTPTLNTHLKRLALLLVMAAIFVIDTLTDYAVAAPSLYAAVILAASGSLRRRGLLWLAASCIVLVVVSFGFTRFGALRLGIVNSLIGTLVIVSVTWLVLKMEAAKTTAAHAQAQMLRVARVSTMGELTTSIAHEINQPLAAIATSAEAAERWLRQAPPNVEKAVHTVARIRSDAYRASEVIARVRSLVRGEPPHASAFDLGDALREVLSVSRADLDRQGMDIQLDALETLPLVWADRAQIQQVIANLLVNAVDAMEHLPVAAGRRIELALCLLDNQQVRLSVRDHGTGLDAVQLEHLFDAFWTTKKNGLGLGLSLSRSIAQANAGRISGEPAQGGGARFMLDLPMAEVAHAA